MNRYVAVLWIVAAILLVLAFLTHDPTVSGGVPG